MRSKADEIFVIVEILICPLQISMKIWLDFDNRISVRADSSKKSAY